LIRDDGKIRLTEFKREKVRREPCRSRVSHFMRNLELSLAPTYANRSTSSSSVRTSTYNEKEKGKR